MKVSGPDTISLPNLPQTYKIVINFPFFSQIKPREFYNITDFKCLKNMN